MDALDVPGVEEFVRRELGETLVALFVLEGEAGDVEGTGIGVLQPAAASGQGMDDEEVAIERKAAEYLSGGLGDGADLGE